MARCGWVVAYHGPCPMPGTEQDGRCERHTGKVCASCGAPATRECTDTFQFVCGAPLCDDCVGANATGGGHHRKPGRPPVPPREEPAVGSQFSERFEVLERVEPYCHCPTPDAAKTREMGMGLGTRIKCKACGVEHVLKDSQRDGLYWERQAR